MQQLADTLHFAIDIYDVNENDEAISLRLKSEIFKGELIPFLKKFYGIMYPGKDHRKNTVEVIEKLKTTSPVDWMIIAEDKNFYFFQKNDYSKNDILLFEKDFRPQVDVFYDCIMLSAEGKIIMEEYGRQFHFFKYCMKEAFKDFAIAGALRVYITG